MAMRPTFRVMVVGAGFSGRSELVRTAVFSVSSQHQIIKHDVGPNEVGIETDVGSFILTVNTWLSKLAFSSLEAALQDQRIVAEVAELSRADVLLFILDPRAAQRAANLRVLRTLREHLERLCLLRKRIVFFVNEKANANTSHEMHSEVHQDVLRVLSLDDRLVECVFMKGSSTSETSVRTVLAACSDCSK